MENTQNTAPASKHAPSGHLAADTSRLFLPVAVGLTALLALMYANEQQLLRQGANEPQTYLADDAASRIAGGSLLADVASSTRIEIESSSAPYIVIYDTNGAPMAGTGYLNGALPSIPLAVFDVARSSGEDRITWQPMANVREAIVVRPVTDPNGTGAAYVMSGRSLAYVEHEEGLLAARVIMGWAGIMLTALVASFLAAAYIPRRPRAD